ncbi:FAD-dependent thymidylate synthase [bacterium]|nr:FAD-dependent thymidylate synthase [candidate division CSSED10-310 bacterium]
MKLILAGHNIDKEILNEWRRFLDNVRLYLDTETNKDVPKPTRTELEKLCGDLRRANNTTPETLSAAYARISRDPRPVDLLRAESRQWVSKARRSNRRIVFGMGHASVAEHAVFNIDIIGISRYVTEFIQSHRLCSFTEKSQRYVKLDKDFIIPLEIKNAGFSGEFSGYVKRCFETYLKIIHILEHTYRKPAEETGEDARYVLPLNVTTQMGMTLNARNLEYLLQNAASSGIAELREFGNGLFQVIEGIAPSLIKHTSGTPILKFLYKNLQRTNPIKNSATEIPPAVKLLYATPDADDIVLSALSARNDSTPLQNIIENIQGQPANEKAKPITDMLHLLNPWDPVPRELEYGVFRFEIIISAAAYGQFKRHRMATMTPSSYDPSLGLCIPPLLSETGTSELLLKIAEEADTWHRKLSEIDTMIAPYALLGAHRRRVIVQMNARELIHLSRLREDIHAQWDIRTIVSEMILLAKKEMPLCLSLAMGKHRFENDRVYSTTDS